MTDNRTERYMIIFNDVGLTIKGYYNEVITPIQRHKILDRLYNLIHCELFEGVKPLEEQINTSVPMPDNTSPPMPETIKRKKRGRPKKVRRKPKAVTTPDIKPPELVTQTAEPKDPVYDNETDNQYDEFKKKGMI